MNKTTKGALAAGAAGILLLGGAGSYALWSDAETVQGGTITAGNLDISPVAAGVDRRLAGTGQDAGPPRHHHVPDGSGRRPPVQGAVPSTRGRRESSCDDRRGCSEHPAHWRTDPDEHPGVVGQHVQRHPLANNQITEADNNRLVDVTVTVTFVETTPNQVGTEDSVNLSAFRINLQQAARTTAP